MKEQLNNMCQKLDQSVRDNTKLISDNISLTNKAKKRRSRKRHSEEESSSDSDLEDASTRRKTENPRKRRAKNQLEVQHLHLEEKMYEIENRLVKTYKEVQVLDEDILTSLLKKGEEIYRNSLDKLEDYRYNFHKELSMLKEELSTSKYKIYLILAS